MSRSERPEVAQDGAHTRADVPHRVRCIWCQKLHRPVDPEGFSAVCPRCEARSSILRLLDMDGSHPLSLEGIDEAVAFRRPGNYALGFMDAGSFVVFYVGRSDSDVGDALRRWVGVASGRNATAMAPAGRAAWATRPGQLLPLSRATLGAVASAESSYTRFAFSYAASPGAAFAEECRNYDDFGSTGELDNAAGPALGTSGH